MSTVVLTQSLAPSMHAEKILNIPTRLWFVLAVAGQWMFAYYVAALYGGSALRGDWTVWHKRMAHGHGRHAGKHCNGRPPKSAAEIIAACELMGRRRASS